MCGIVGQINLDGAPVTYDEIERMRAMLVHRGPDDSGRLLFSLRAGTFSVPGADAFDSQHQTFEGALGFNRLSIIDLSRNGHQPMVSSDGKSIIVFNGEIYNADEYRFDLERRGCQFRGHSDTEVLLNLYCCYGIEETLSRINGMFAFGIVDLAKQEVHLARDRLGIKPLYLFQNSRTIAFASEVKAFLASTGFEPDLNQEVVDEFLKFGYIAGEETLLRNVRSIRPGECVTLRRGRLHSRTYWALPAPGSDPSMPLSAAEELVEEALQKSVKYRLRSDVEVGCQLSGGIDSSLISLLATRHLKGKRPTAISVVHADPKYNEEPWIDLVAARLGMPVNKLLLADDEFLSKVEKATWHRDFPINTPSSVSIMCMSEVAKKYFTVFLSGEGADELFGGYERFFGGHFLGRRLNYELLRRTPVANRLLTERYVTNHAGVFDRRDWFITRSTFFGTTKLKQLYPAFSADRMMDKRRLMFDAGGGSFISKAQAYELKTWLVDLLLRQDKMTMAHAIENRVPFLDHNLVELARRLPVNCLVGRDPRFTRSTKIVLKRIAARHFGRRFAYRRKIGFHIPLIDYFSGEYFKQWFHEEILPSIGNRGIFDPGAVEHSFASCKPGAYQEIFSVWRMVAFEVWAQQMLDGRDAKTRAYPLPNMETVTPSEGIAIPDPL